MNFEASFGAHNFGWGSCPTVKRQLSKGVPTLEPTLSFEVVPTPKIHGHTNSGIPMPSTERFRVS